MIIFMRLFKYLMRKNTLIFILIIALILVIVCGFLFSLFESMNEKQKDFTFTYLFNFEENPNDIFDGFWWAIVTMTTVGYGDKFPVSLFGRIIAVPLMIVGIGILGLLIGVIADSILELRSRLMKGLGVINLTDHIIICGWNSFKIDTIIKEIRGGASLKNSSIVLVNDKIDENPYESSDNIYFIKGHPSDSEVLKRAGVEKCSKAIILAEDASLKSDDTTILTVLQIESLNKNVFTCAELIDIGKSDLLRKANCDEIVTANDFGVKLLVQSIEDPGLSLVMGDMLSNTYGAQIDSEKVASEYVGKNYSEMFLDMYNKNKVLIALKHGIKHIVNPDKTLTVNDDDVIYYIHVPSR